MVGPRGVEDDSEFHENSSASAGRLEMIFEKQNSAWRELATSNSRGKTSAAGAGKKFLVGPRGVEPLTSSTSRMRSNQLSYEPVMSICNLQSSIEL